MKSVFLVLACFILNLALKAFCADYIIPPVNLTKSPYDLWAHYHWVWLANPEENQKNISQLVSDYISYDIPVGAVNIDSSWPMTYQNFIWNEEKFPNASEMVNDLHKQNVKVVCWITSTINNDSTNFNEGLERGYYLNKGKLIHWWRGHGALLDYSNPNAVDWWHKQMDLLLDIGIDGWKCDGTDPYVFELIDAHGYKGRITEREYADYYYRDFFYYTQEKRGPSALIMARPVDNFDDIIFLKYAPHDVMFSGWVGDQDGSWKGIHVALNNIVHSAWQNYLNFGSDIGGYRTDGSLLGRDKLVFTRWFQLGTFLPLMENGGNGEHRPWIFGKDTLDTYRQFAHIHTDLAPFLLSQGTKLYAKNVSQIQPLAKKSFIVEPSTFDFILSEKFYVSPFTDNSTKKRLEFPGEKSVQWVYWFNQSKVFSGGQAIEFDCSFSEFPVFILGGSIVPLNVKSSYSNMGTKNSKDFITVMITKPMRGYMREEVHEFGSNGYTVEYEYDDVKGVIDIKISAHNKNKFIILLSGRDAKKAKTSMLQINSNNKFNFEPFESFEDKDNFWHSSQSGTYYNLEKNLNQYYVRISDVAIVGIHLRIENIY